MVERVQDLLASRVGPSEPHAPVKRPAQAPPTPGQAGFPDALQRAEGQRAGQLHFSQHAQRRLQSREIALDQGDIERLERAVDKAASKGARDSLILMDELALVVNIQNRTVVTAIDKASRQEGVFTNIDSVVVT